MKKFNQELKIENGIPIPEEKRGPNRLYKWDDFKVGDSVFFKDRTQGNSAVGSLINYIKKNKLDWKYTSRSNNDGMRIWRTK